jgi:hypothetical protein
MLVVLFFAMITVEKPLMTHAPSTYKHSTYFPALPRFLTRPQLLTRI